MAPLVSEPQEFPGSDLQRFWRGAGLRAARSAGGRGRGVRAPSGHRLTNESVLEFPPSIAIPRWSPSRHKLLCRRNQRKLEILLLDRQFKWDFRRRQNRVPSVRFYPLAFADDLRAARLKFEYEVRSLGEPRPTSVDVLLCGGQERVAVECKFTERAFGVCSRPALHRGDTNYCDGSYRVQHGRGTRCALTEQRIRYWQYLPGLFDWPANRDHNPCPFGAVYQLARNGLAASVDLDRAADCPAAHALVVYDTRNPEFSGNGKAARQWAAATGACRQPGLLRRVTWQHLIVALARAPEMGYLVEALEAKYGLRPS